MFFNLTLTRLRDVDAPVASHCLGFRKERTMSTLDIRWQQRFDHYQKALRQLEDSVELSGRCSLSELEKLGLIKVFEFTHELAWNVMKDYFEYQGTTSLMGARDAVREAFQKGMVADGEG